MSKALRRRSAKAQGLVEYALILVLVSIATILILSQTGSTIKATYCKVVTALGGAPGCGFSGTITTSSSTDGFRYYQTCTFTVATSGTYEIDNVTTNKSSQFWVTAGGSGPATGYSAQSTKTGGVASTGYFAAGTSYSAFPHSTTPSDLPLQFSFTLTGPGNVTGSC